MSQIFVILFLIIGAFFCLTAAVGILTFPDIYTRMHASAKSGTLGVGCIVLAVGVDFATAEVAIESALIFIFFVLTAPVAAHAIARAAFFTGEPLWDKSVINEVGDRELAKTYLD